MSWSKTSSDTDPKGDPGIQPRRDSPSCSRHSSARASRPPSFCLPFAFLAGVIGAFFKPLALTMAICLGVSFVIAALIVPVTIGRLGMGKRTDAPRPEPAQPLRFLGWYERAVAVCIRRGGVTAAALGGCIVVMLWLYRGDRNRFPAGDGRRGHHPGLLDAARARRSPTPTRCWAKPRRSSGRCPTSRAIPGAPVPSWASSSPSRIAATTSFALKPRREQRRDIDVVMDDLRARIQAAEPAIATDFGQLLEDDIGDLTGGVPQPIDIKVFGSDPALLATRGAGDRANPAVASPASKMRSTAS